MAVHGSYDRTRGLLLCFAAATCALICAGTKANGQTRPARPPAARPPAARKPAARKPRIVYPRVVKFVRAPYPEAARKAGRQGVVRLEVVVGVNGRVRSAKVVRSVSPDLDEAARKAVLKFVYTPAEADGKKVAAKIIVLYPFKLRKTPAKPSRPPARARPVKPPARARPVKPPARARPVKPPPRPARPAARPAEAEKLLARIGGRIREKGTRRPLEDAEVLAYPYRPKTKQVGKLAARVFADSKGRFTLEKLVPGPYRIEVRAPGCYVYRVTEKLKAGMRLKVEYYVERRSYDPYTTVITSKAERKEVSRRIVALPEIQKIPGTQGDAVRSVQNMPGVARVSFGQGDLIIRGSSPRESRIFVNGHQIPLMAHFGGGPSTVNGDILREIVFIPGNFSVRYGRAAGGVVDLFTRKGKRDRWHGYVDVDIWDGGVLVEGPVGKGSVLLAARRSWIDGILSLIPADKFGVNMTLAPAYYDYQAMLDYPLLGGRFKLFIFGSDDRMKLLFQGVGDSIAQDQFSYKLFYHKAIAAWKKTWGRNTVQASVAVGLDRYNQYWSENFRVKVDTSAAEVRAEYTRKFHKRLSLSVGTVGYYAMQWADFSIPPIPEEGEVPLPVESTSLLVAKAQGTTVNQAFFVESTWSPTRFLTLIPGLRTDILEKGPMFAVVFDPRLTVKFPITKKVELKTGVGVFHQEPDVTQIILETGGNPYIAHERGLHSSAGVKWFIRKTLSLEATGFFNYRWRRIVRSNRVVRRDGVLQPENLTNRGEGRIYGGELLVRKKADRDCPRWLKLTKCFGWLSYTISRSERQDTSDDRWRLFDYDQTHILTLVLYGEWPRGWAAGIRFRLASGNPYTPMERGIFDADANQYIGTPGKINSRRMPLFHQLDVRVDKKFVFNKWFLTLYLDIQNVYHNQTEEFMIYNFNYTKRGYLKGLPIIPSLGLKGSF